MAATGGPDAGGRPPVDLRNDLIGQVTAPVMAMLQISKPYTAADSIQWLLAARARDGRVLDSALGRIHEAFIARGNKDARRVLNNTNIYLLPGLDAFAAMLTGGGMGRGQESGVHSGFAVAGEHLVFGSLKWVEQSVRDAASGHRGAGIVEDPMYRYASQFIPAQAGGVAYVNQQMIVGMLWDQIKAAAKEPPPQANPPAPQPGPGQFPQFRQPPRPTEARATAMGQMVTEFEKYADFNALPEFPVIRKHFGATIFYVKGNSQGLYLEGMMVKAPPRQ